MRILITGGCGFLGHHVVEHFLKETDWDVVVVDMLTYASSGFDRLRDVKAYDDKRVTLVGWDISEEPPEGVVREIGNVDYIVHLAAETHVDNSIVDPFPFVKSNVMGTYRILNLAKDMTDLKMILNFSTDEVFGPAPQGVFYQEHDMFNPTNPYAATKAGAVFLGEAMRHSWQKTYHLPVVTTFTMNIFGERQHPEKFIPKCINASRHQLHLPIHSDATKSISGSRCWIHARNVASAVHFLLDNAEVGQRYNIVGEEKTNLDIAEIIADEVGKSPEIEMVDFHTQRPGHDLRYALDGSKLRDMGWKPPVDLDGSLRKVVRWSLLNRQWLEVK
jgi:dTDP-glucose 4,6-dehydratase